MQEAYPFFVQIDELAFAIGERLAELTGAEWGIVPAGCACALKHITAACVAGGNPEKLVRIPNLTGFEKTEVLSPRRARNTYDSAITNVGVTMIDVDTPEEMANAITSRTALIHMMANNQVPPDGPFSLEQVARMAAPRNIPILVDAAAEDLTVPNVHLQRGATVVAYSGGKALCGPQSAGLLLGNKDLLMSAWQASAPHHGPGRDSKVNKDEQIAMVAAVEDWVSRDHAAKVREWNTWLQNIARRLSAINGISCTVSDLPSGLSNRSLNLRISWNPEAFNLYGTDVAEILATTKPRIALSGSYLDNNGMTGVGITSGQMQPGEDRIVADRLYEVLSQKHDKPKDMAAPRVNISGRWDVDIDFFSSKGRHQLYIEQDGNQIKGSHKGDFTTRDMYGIVDGNQIMMFSRESQNARNVPFTFHGTATNDKIEGGIYMGEYLRVKGFAATRYEQVAPANPRIVVPQGQPLAT
jgi:seryl-tRNA(Sec) selenium transferase